MEEEITSVSAVDAVGQVLHIGDLVAYVRKPGSAEAVHFIAEIVTIDDRAGQRPAHNEPASFADVILNPIHIHDAWKPDNVPVLLTRQIKCSNRSVVKLDQNEAHIRFPQCK
jgi:hypothetical protein